ncbi:hypothetical protein Barb6XT_00296 [Bacteroidales bacterium Barb6XT]|nr:hypothetical protein Barb6XT_00296 [Bacteroidales bacterium Barb6XT]
MNKAHLIGKLAYGIAKLAELLITFNNVPARDETQRKKLVTEFSMRLINYPVTEPEPVRHHVCF